MVTRSARVWLVIGAGCVARAALGLGGDEATRDSVRIDGTTVMLEMVRTPAGSVQLRDETVSVPALWASQTEVTWDLYDVYLYGLDKPDPDAADADGVSRPSKPYVPPDRGLGHAGFPALGMTRQAAREFCVWLSHKTGVRYRLPTEAEWVYLASARAGAGDGLGGASIDEAAWHEGNADWGPHPVGKKSANAFGLHDMLGNVAEWVDSREEPPFALGGSYLDPPERCAPLSRSTQTPMWNSSDPQIPKSRWWLADCGFVGFRVVRDAEANGAAGQDLNQTE